MVSSIEAAHEICVGDDLFTCVVTVLVVLLEVRVTVVVFGCLGRVVKNIRVAFWSIVEFTSCAVQHYFDLLD